MTATWAELFERAAAYGTDLATVRDRLAERRASRPGDGGDDDRSREPNDSDDAGTGDG